MPEFEIKKNESNDDFVTRCIADPIMKGEYPSSDQRRIVCNKILAEKASHPDKKKRKDKRGRKKPC